ncbi:MAG TPA: NYN domain-containing protein, partial [Bacteroidia bacterium]|nr:NYN domain-containing protein [Bacteroidia bacterium]
MTTSARIALLIDGDNANHNLLKYYIDEASKFGRVTIKRIYGDWTLQYMTVWKEKLNILAVRPMQKFSYTKGKNSTDTALIIDAMDLIFSKTVDGFCIVSSDSDYTGIAHRIREEGLMVVGIGKSTTPDAFIGACENFIFEEILNPQSPDKTFSQSASPEKHPAENILKTKAPKLPVRKVVGMIDLSKFKNKVTNKSIDPTLIDKAYEMAFNIDRGAANASLFSASLIKLDSTFDIRNYGYTSFKAFVEALKPRYESFFDD